MSKLHTVLDLLVLGMATIVGLTTGGVGIAVAGIAVYLLGQTDTTELKTKG